MTFPGTRLISLSLSFLIAVLQLQQTAPEFVVHEVVACCHHEVSLKCGESDSSSLKIGIIQARYLVPGSEYKYMENRLDSPWSESENAENGNRDPRAASYSTYSHPNYVSLWDMDVTFVHEIHHSQNKLINLNEPAWMRYFQKVDFLPVATTPNPVPPGFNFTQDKLLEMPFYPKRFLDKNTIWAQPLFQLKYQNNHSSSHTVRPRPHPSFSSSPSYLYPPPSREWRDDVYFPPCLSYEALLSRGQLGSGSSSTHRVPKTSQSQNRSNKSRYFWINVLRRRQEESERKRKPAWHYTDLRSVFNQRCSGRSKCSVDLLRNKLRDQDLTRVCNKWPDGRIVVKYLCYDSASRQVHSSCNEDMETAREGFIVNPGYPDIYPGGLVCQWKLQVAQQRILLVFLDVSLRGQESDGDPYKYKSSQSSETTGTGTGFRDCRDELSISEQGTKLLSTCGDHKSAIAVLSFSSTLNVTFSPRSHRAFPKRGFLLYFRALGCKQPSETDLRNAYIVSRNASHINVHCVLGSLFPDSLTNSRWLSCNSLDNTWVPGVTFCRDIRTIMTTMTGTNSTINPRYVLDKDTEGSHIIVDYIVPACIMLLLFVLNGFVILWIRKMKARSRSVDLVDIDDKQEMEEILPASPTKGMGITPEESTYTLSSDGTEGATPMLGPTIKNNWMQADESITTTPVHAQGTCPNGKVNGNGGIGIGGIPYTPVPTNGNPFPYGFPRTTSV